MRFLLPFVVLALLLAGCSTVNSAKLNGKKHTATANASNASLVLNADGSSLSMANHPPVQFKDGALSMVGTGTGSVISITVGEVQVRTFLPKNATASNLEFNFDDKARPTLKIGTLEINASDVIAAADAQVLNAQGKTAEMTTDEAAARKAATDKISDAVGEAVKGLIK